VKKYTFKLESVFRYRKFLEKIAKIKVSSARYEVVKCKDQIEMLKKQHNEIVKALTDQLSSGVDSDQYQNYTKYISGIDSMMEFKNNNLLNFIKKMVEKQKELEAQSIKKKTIQTLKENRKIQYYKDLSEKIQKEADDAILLRKAKNNIERQ